MSEIVTLGWQRDYQPLVHVRCPTSRVAYVRSVLSGRYDSPDPPGVEVRRVLDIGAGVGEFALYAAARWAGCWVDCWEPDAELRALLEENGPAGMRVIERVAEDWSAYQVIRMTTHDHGAGLVDAEYGSPKMTTGALLIVDYQERR